jgi:pimeloyl-ACP methyl ester carboxylesterase
MPIIQTLDIHTYYEQSGRGNPLLFIHGLGATTTSWALQVPVFSSGYRVVTYDLRGHGRTSRPRGPYSIPQFAGDAASLLQILASGPTHVVGLSLGGAIAFQLALERPDLVQTLTVVNSAPGLTLQRSSDRLRWAAFVGMRWLIGHTFSMRQQGNILARRLFPAPEQAELRRLFAEEFAHNDRRAYNASIRALLSWNVMDRIGEIHCPTLIVSADHDYTPVSFKAAYVARMPNAVLQVIPNSGHATTIDQAERFNAVLGEFLAGTLRADASETVSIATHE